MLEEDRVKSYFEERAEEFDSIYEPDKSLSQRFINRIFRKGMVERVRFVLERFDYNGKTVLDIGCGPGQVTIALALRGAIATGIDYSDEMIRLAHKHVSEAADGATLSKNIQFVKADLLQFQPERKFDVTLALGVFDYIQDPVPVLDKIRSLTSGVFIASFPARYALQMPIRKIWLWRRKCPVYFYTEKGLQKIYQRVSVNCSITKIPAGYMVVAGEMSERSNRSTSTG